MKALCVRVCVLGEEGGGGSWGRAGRPIFFGFENENAVFKGRSLCI